MIVIVLGMHRSGTSTIAGILHLNNILMGTIRTFGQDLSGKIQKVFMRIMILERLMI